MRKAILLAAAVFASLASLQAQDKSDSSRVARRDIQKHQPGEFRKMHKRPGMDLKKELGLTDEQGAKLKTVNQNFAQKMKALREDKSLSAEDKKAKFKALSTERSEEVKSILGPEKFKALEEKRKARQHRPGNFGKKDGQPKKDLKAELGLTDEQSAKLKAVNQNFAQKMKALREDQSLSAEDKKTKLKALGTERNEEIKAIVGAEKFKILEEKRKEMKGKHPMKGHGPRGKDRMKDGQKEKVKSGK